MLTKYFLCKAVWCSGYCCCDKYQWVVGSIPGVDTIFNKLNKILKLIKSARICSEMVSLIGFCSELFLSDLIRSGLSDQNWSESDLKIWPYSLPFEVGKILSGFRSDPTNSDQICSDLVGHGKDLSWASPARWISFLKRGA